MLVDRKQYNELQKEDGGVLGFECTAIAKVLEAKDLKKVDSCNLSIYPKGLYMSFLLSYKLYFSLENLREVKINDGVIEIYIDGEDPIKMTIEKKEDAVKVYTVLISHLGKDYDEIPLKDYISGEVNTDVKQDDYCHPVKYSSEHSYIIDCKEYDKLIKEAGFKLEFNEVVKVLEAPELKKVNTTNLWIHTNGLYVRLSWNYKLYFPMEELNNVIYDNNIVQIYLKTGEIIKLESEKKKVLLKLDKVLRKYLGDMVGEFNYDKEAMFEAKFVRERKKIEIEKMLEINKEKEAEMEERNEYLAQKDTTIAHCPKCGSTSLTANKKGFSATTGVIGLAVSPLAGAVVGGAGRNKVIVTCLKCGHQWKAGKK